MANNSAWNTASQTAVLLPGEQLRSATRPNPGSKVELTLEQALCRLCGVSTLEEVGSNGPVKASVSFSDDADAALQKYETLFGRDSLLVALFLADKFPALLQATVTRLAQLQGTSTNTHSEEQPGRIIHEFRNSDDPVAQDITEREGWQWPYYGSIDSTPLFILGCKKLDEFGVIDWQQQIVRNDKEVSLRQVFEDAVGWVLFNLSKSELGLMETHKSFETSIDNQTWKDSFDSGSYADGQLAFGKVSSSEVQAQTYDALRYAAEVLSEFGSTELVVLVDDARQALLDGFKEFYILDTDIRIAHGVGYVDGQPKPMEILSSNIGHLLGTQLLDDVEVEGLSEWIVDSLFSPELLAGAGVRSLATNAVRYRPGGYHCGNVWLWESALFAIKLKEIGQNDLARELALRVSEACKEFGGYPEFARGEDVIAFNELVIDVWDPVIERLNRIEQPPQQIQAWTVAGLLALVSVGLVVDGTDVGEPRLFIDDAPEPQETRSAQQDQQFLASLPKGLFPRR